MVTALSIAGSDSIGGAGIQADIKAMTSLGVHATTVITALTAQNTISVEGIFPVPGEFISQQLKSILLDVDLMAAKSGMLYCAETVDTVVEIWPAHIPLVVDPVLVAGVGDPLYKEDLISAIRDRLIPIAALVTPNRMEAEALAGFPIDSEEDAMKACEAIGRCGTPVFLKGGHMESDLVTDLFYRDGEFHRLEYPRLERAGHGGGCTLAAYIASHLALGDELGTAVRKSRDLIQKSIASMFEVGRGERLVNPSVNTELQLEKVQSDLFLSRAQISINNAPYSSLGRLSSIEMACALPYAFDRKDFSVLSGPVLTDAEGCGFWQAESETVSETLSGFMNRIMDADDGRRWSALVRFREPASMDGLSEQLTIMDEDDLMASGSLDSRTVPEIIYLNKIDGLDQSLVITGNGYRELMSVLKRLW